MDYEQIFRDLKPNYKYCRKSPEKAVLLLSVIEMYENELLINSEIHYDKKLNDTYAKIWEKVITDDSLFCHDAFLAFWFMQNEDFWHLIPKDDDDSIPSSQKFTEIIPTEDLFYETVDHAEIDEDLAFLMTLPSGRSSLRRSLLETYTTLTPKEIEEFSKSKDNAVDYSKKAIETYNDIIHSSDFNIINKVTTDKEEISQNFESLDEDVRLVFYIEYYSFLKKNKYSRDLIREIYSSPSDLYDKISSHPYKHGDIPSSIYLDIDMFLAELRITLMYESSSIELIENIDNAIQLLKPDADEEQNNSNISLDNEILEEADSIDLFSSEDETTQNESESLSLEEESSCDDYYVENKNNEGTIFSISGEKLYQTSGQLKIIRGKIYRFNKKPMCLTVKELIKDGDSWYKGPKVIVSYVGRELFSKFHSQSFIDQIEDLITSDQWSNNLIKADGDWYDSKGCWIGPKVDIDFDNLRNKGGKTEDRKKPLFIPPGKMKDIDNYIYCSYDYLWLIALASMMYEDERNSSLSFDDMACKMIATSWEILNARPELKDKEEQLTECINYLIEESKDNMDNELDWTSSADIIYPLIKDYPMSDVFEDTVEDLIKSAPYDILKTWIKTEDLTDLTISSANFANSCLYSVHPRKIDPYIVINPDWYHTLIVNRVKLIDYYKNKYVNFLTNYQCK